MRIGVFDSGLGGLTVLRELLKRVPGAHYTYLGDTARAPYGSKSPQTIIRYSRECQKFLEAKGLDLLVVACNTASALALKDLRASASYPIIGTIEPAVRAALKDRSSGPVGVIGTRATIQSRVYEQAINSQLPGTEVLSVACPLFVPLVEEGVFEGPIVDQVVEHYLQTIRQKGVSSVILGCTHYPLLSPVIAGFFPPQVRIVECSRAIADEVSERFPEVVTGQVPATPEFYVTDEVSRFNALASALLDGIPVHAVSLEDLTSLAT